MDISKWLYILFSVMCHESLCTDNVESRKYGERIVGGQETDIEFHPYQVYVLSKVGCGGSIIGRRWILTAAHCLKTTTMTETIDFRHPEMIKVLVGSTNVLNGTIYKIRSAIRHPLYFVGYQKYIYYDFMLLELTKPLVYGPKVRPIKIGEEEDIVAGKYGIATGWGRTENGTASLTLRGVALPIVDFYKCNQIYKDELLPCMFCVGWKEGRNACKGDSGGPFVVDGKLLGLTSYGEPECAQRGKPTVYASVLKVRSWIHRVTGI